MYLWLLNKQALHEALMRQEDFLAYTDSQESTKFRVNNHHLKVQNIALFQWEM